VSAIVPRDTFVSDRNAHPVLNSNGDERVVIGVHKGSHFRRPVSRAVSATVDVDIDGQAC